MRIASALCSLALGASLLALALRTPAAPLEAGTAVRLELTELCRTADEILEGRVMASESRELADGRIETLLDLSVDRAFRGSSAGLRRLRMPGGVLPDGRGMLLPGLTLPRPGEEVLLFLSQESGQGWRLPLGLSQGHFRLQRLPDGRKLAVRSQAELSLASLATRQVEEADAAYVIDYAELCAEIERARAFEPRTGASGR